MTVIDTSTVQIISQISSDDIIKYLGIKFHPFGIKHPDEVPLKTLLYHVEKAPLKS